MPSEWPGRRQGANLRRAAQVRCLAGRTRAVGGAGLPGFAPDPGGKHRNYGRTGLHLGSGANSRGSGRGTPERGRESLKWKQTRQNPRVAPCPADVFRHHSAHALGGSVQFPRLRGAGRLPVGRSRPRRAGTPPTRHRKSWASWESSPNDSSCTACDAEGVRYRCGRTAAGSGSVHQPAAPYSLRTARLTAVASLRSRCYTGPAAQRGAWQSLGVWGFIVWS